MKIIAIGRNYSEHAKEMNSPVPSKPIIFMKPNSAVLKDGKPFYYPDFSNNIHYEGELVLKICKNGKSIKEEFANDYYSEVTFGLDMTARDLQEECKENGWPWEIAKAFDRSAVLGKFISKHDFKDVNNLVLRLEKDGKEVQKGNTKDLIFSIPYIISYVSRFFTLNVGDLIFTGTPDGVGPVACGEHYSGYLGDYLLLEMDVK